MTSFIGRKDELGEVAQALERSRLITLCGVGGVGKTRLALRAAAQVETAFPDGVWLAELSALREPAMLARRVAEAMRLPDLAAGDPLDLLAEHLADRRLLLILDTCEHLPDACAMLAEVLLRAAPGLRIVATSREPLDVLGEHVVRVAPLAAPTPDAAETDDADGVAGVDDFDAVALFLDRAALTIPRRALDDLDRRSVASLCHRLDGIPLAIELAAVRLRTMSLEQILERLHDRFKLLGAARGRQDRQQTLRATVEWSHHLCGPDERLLWARLAAFPGGFDLIAAEAVCADEIMPGDVLADTIGRLVDKSIVQYERDTGRYRMLDTIREFGLEELELLGGREELSRRHRDHYLALAESAMAEGIGPRQLAWIHRIRREHHNVRVALDYSMSTPGEQGTGLRMARTLHPYWVYRGLFGEGRDWLSRGLAAYPERDLERCNGLIVGAIMHALLGEIRVAETLLNEADLIAHRYDDDYLRARMLLASGITTFCAGEEESLPLLEAARESFLRVGFRSPYDLACFPHLVALQLYGGDLDSALATCESGIAVCDSTGETMIRKFIVLSRSLVRLLRGDLEGASRDARDGLEDKAEDDDLLSIAVALDSIAGVVAAQGDNYRATVLGGAANSMWKMIRSPMLGPSYAELRKVSLQAAMAPLTEAERAEAIARGAAMTIAEAVAEARSTGKPGEPAKSDSPLSKRELEVAGLVAEGLTNREIAERLVVAKRTVDSHIEHILAKLGFTSRTQIAVWSDRQE
ncbi:LuxR C-terminal-related transcriptional regulator [Actinomadura barringtoniae]|uniref:LuxR C-terminal-related transcriptional regulator n=1 Tax=Actinomadura barringtoniae TaxID=1427535 RepID=UPI0027DB4894|nr:LuxR C-terminal-related transcriptional regulator [Actinomadura barringtoniae]